MLKYKTGDDNISFEIIQKQYNINKTLNRFAFKDERTLKDIEEIRKIVNEYIKSKGK